MTPAKVLQMNHLLDVTSRAFIRLRLLRKRITFLLSSPEHPHPVNHLIFFSLHAAGDFLMSTQAIIEAKKILKPEYSLLVVSNDAVRQLADLSGIVNRVICLNEFSNVEITAEQSLVVSLTGPSYELLDIINSKKLAFIGFLNSFRIETNLRAYQAHVNSHGSLAASHHIYRNNCITSCLSWSDFQPIPNISAPGIEKAFKSYEALSPGRMRIGIFLPQQKSYKCYPPDKAEELIKLLSTIYPLVVFAHINDDLGLDLKDGPNLDFFRFKSWHELLEHLSTLRLVICTDSVVYHLCGLLHIPCIALFGNTSHVYYKSTGFVGHHFDRTNGFSCYRGSLSSKRCSNLKCRQYCMNLSNINPSSIIDSVNEQLMSHA